MAKQRFQPLLSDHCLNRSLFIKVMAYSFCGLLPHKRICLLYSIVKDPRKSELLSLIKIIKLEEGIRNRLLITSYLIFTSKLGIIFIIASRIRPLSSISTAIYTFPYSSYKGLRLAFDI